MRQLTRDENALIFLDSFESLEYKHKKALLDLAKTPCDLFRNTDIINGYFSSIGKPQIASAMLLALKNKDYVKEIIQSSLVGADDVITLASENYPIELANIPTPPIVLYARGNLSLLKRQKFAIVGSRKTLPLYAKKAEEIAQRLSSSGVVIVTGIAEGADTSAIKGALPSGNIISVFAGEVGKVYPSTANELAQKIITSGGLILSEFPAGRTPRVYSYPIRNRIIAGLSLGALIVSGAESSGARYTAGYSVDFGREVFCLPYGIGVASGEICKSLIKNGAVMVESAEEIASALNINLKEENQEEIALSASEQTLYKLIRYGVSNTDILAERSGLMIFEIISALGMLELKGLIVKDSNGEYSSSK